MSQQPVATNRQARFNYFISDTFEAGIVLNGSEVKSIREGRVNLNDAYIKIFNGEVYVVGMHVSPYSHTENILRIDPTQSRKLLLHKQEIEKLLIIRNVQFTAKLLSSCINGQGEMARGASDAETIPVLRTSLCQI